MTVRQWCISAILVVMVGGIHAAEPLTGPVIEEFGRVFEVPEDAWNLQQGVHYKVSMDVAATAEKSSDLNRRIESAARFLNLHARNGIDPGDIEFAIVVHAAAGKDLLTDAAYKTRFGVANPNTAMLNALDEAGVTIYICGQTAAYRGFATNELNPVVKIAVSAMTAHVRLQSEGYTLIPF